MAAAELQRRGSGSCSQSSWTAAFQLRGGATQDPRVAGLPMLRLWSGGADARGRCSFVALRPKDHESTIFCFPPRLLRCRLRILLIFGVGELLDKIDDGSPKLCVWDLHERFGQLKSIRGSQIV
jgi:hypothetical protein